MIHYFLSPFPLPMNEGNRMGVAYLYFLYYSLLPQTFYAFASNRGTPETLLSNRYTKAGEIIVKYCQFCSDLRTKMLIPNHTSTSPQ
jgi:hypothetical protein